MTVEPHCATGSPSEVGAAPGRDLDCVPLRRWKWTALRGVLALALGILAIIFPTSALVGFALVFAAFAFADGVMSILSGLGFGTGRSGHWWALILRGVVGIAIGIVFVLWPVLTTIGYAIALLWLFAIWAILSGIFEISAAIRLRREIEGEWLLGLSGLVSILVGVGIPVLLFVYPVAATLSLAWAIGFYALASGALLIMQSLRLRSRYNERCAA